MMKINNTYSLLFILFFGITFALQGQEKSNKTVTGTVVNATNDKPLEGVNVRVGTFSSVSTDENGAFTIKVPDTRATLIVSNPAFQNKEVALKGRSQVEIKINNKDFNSYYNDIHLPLRNQSNSSVANAVSVIEGSISTPKESIANMLTGNEVSGMRSIMRSGVPGIGTNNFIRGYNTLNGSTQPLVILDGMMIETNTFNNNSIIQGYNYDPLSNINPKDIANITVIKDAASIYGSRAANGVILIETNKTNDVATKIDFYVQGGLNMAPNNIRMMNADQYKTYLSDQLSAANGGGNTIGNLPFFNENRSFEDYEKYHNSTDWQDEIFSNDYVNEYYLRVTGGDEIAKYGLSIGYSTNEGVVSNSAFDRFTTRFNADTNITDRLSLATNLSVSYTDRSLFDDGLLSSSPIFSALNKSPFLAPFTENADGIITDIYEDVDDIGGFSNPKAITDTATFEARDYSLYGQLNFSYKISNKITLKSLSGANYIKNRQNVFLPDLGLGLEDNEFGDSFFRTSKVSIESLFAIYNDTRLNYLLNVNNMHDFSINLGVRYNQNEYENSYSVSGNASDDQFTSLNNGDRDTFVTSGNIGNWNYVSLYANADYSFLNKYFVSYNVAFDSSSRFGDDKSVGIFPSIGAGWLVSSENFMADSKVFDKVKLRASYGITGNDGVGNYNAESYFVSTRFLEGTGLINGNIAQSSIQWEETTKTNLGLDLGLFNEHLSLNFDYFNNVTDNLLNETSINPIFGSDSFLSNDGKLKNNGFELGINARIINTDKFSWDVGGNISQYKNKIISLPGDQQIINIDGVNATILNEEGSALGLFYGYKTDGIYNNAAEASAEGLNWTDFQGFEQPFVAGDVRFVNSDASDNVINEDDRVVIGNPNPDFTGMIYNTFTYKKITLSAIFSFSEGNDVYNAQRRQTESLSGLANQSQAAANRWTVANQNTTIPRAVYGDAVGNSRFSDRWIEDGSYIRLKTLSVSYSPEIVNATFYVTANNLFTITDYLGYDPEVSASQTSYLQGIDAGLTPQYTSVLVGVRVGL